MTSPALDPDQIRQLEATIFAARNYVVPSEELRPSTLALAKETSRIQRIANRWAVMIMSIMLVWLLTMPFLHGISLYRDNFRGAMPEEIERTAQAYASEHRYEPGWGLVDAFQDARRLNFEKTPHNDLHR